MNPVIGISTNFLTVEKGKFIGMERIFVNKDYVDAIVQAGGSPPVTTFGESGYSPAIYRTL